MLWKDTFATNRKKRARVESRGFGGFAIPNIVSGLGKSGCITTSQRMLWKCWRSYRRRKQHPGWQKRENER